MRIKKSLLSILGAGVMSASLVIASGPAEAATNDSDAAPDSAGDSALRYTDRDVVDFLVFARGPIADDKPELVDQLNMTPVLDAPESVTTRVLADLSMVDPEFHERVTVKAQADDPYEAEASLAAFTEDVNAVAAKYEVTSGTVQRAARSASTGAVYAFTNYVVSTQVAVAAAVAVSVLGVVAALVVFAYQRPADSSGMVRQQYAASWSAL